MHELYVVDEGTLVGLVTFLDDEETVRCDVCNKRYRALLTFDGSGKGLGDEIGMCADCFSTHLRQSSKSTVNIESHPRAPRKTLIIHGAHACDVCKTIAINVFSFDASGQVYDPLCICGSCLSGMYLQLSLQKLSLV